MVHEQEDKGGDAQSLYIENVNGIFIVVFVGCSFAIIGGYIELVVICYKNAQKFKVPALILTFIHSVCKLEFF